MYCDVCVLAILENIRIQKKIFFYRKLLFFHIYKNMVFCVS